MSNTTEAVVAVRTKALVTTGAYLQWLNDIQVALAIRGFGWTVVPHESKQGFYVLDGQHTVVTVTHVLHALPMTAIAPRNHCKRRHDDADDDVERDPEFHKELAQQEAHEAQIYTVDWPTRRVAVDPVQWPVGVTLYPRNFEGSLMATWNTADARSGTMPDVLSVIRKQVNKLFRVHQ